MSRALSMLSLVIALLAISASAQVGRCDKVGGVLMTNISAMPFGSEGTNLGSVFGDLAGSVAATQVSNSPIKFQHYWVTTAGDTINFAQATLTPAPTDDPHVVAVRWGNYRSNITGGTGKYSEASGYLDYFGLADFNKLTLVLRYSGIVCYQNPVAVGAKN